jgi:hypothetical protein
MIGFSKVSLLYYLVYLFVSGGQTILTVILPRWHRKSKESPVLSSNDCFIKEPSFSTCLGVDGLTKYELHQSQKYY